MIRLLVSDLDGTLLKIGDELSKGVSDENREALHHFHRQGGLVAIASSRGIDYKAEIEQQIGLPVCFIGLNGCAITDENSVFENSWMDLSEFKEIGERLIAEGFDGVLLTSDEQGKPLLLGKPGCYPWFGEARSPENRIHLQGMPMSTQLNQVGKCHKLSLFVDPAQKKKAAQFLRKEYGERYEIAVSDTDMVDVNHLGVHKGYGVKLLANHLGLSLNEVAVVGDNENDICMFQTVAHSFCIDHAESHIRSEAAHTVKTVAEAVEYCLTIK